MKTLKLVNTLLNRFSIGLLCLGVLCVSLPNHFYTSNFGSDTGFVKMLITLCIVVALFLSMLTALFNSESFNN